jgi:hypothetical protein
VFIARGGQKGRSNPSRDSSTQPIWPAVCGTRLDAATSSTVVEGWGNQDAGPCPSSG